MAVAMPALPPFPHRHNFDRTHTSICPKCFVVVSTDVNERNLLQAELAHVCQVQKLSPGYH